MRLDVGCTGERDESILGFNLMRDPPGPKQTLDHLVLRQRFEAATWKRQLEHLAISDDRPGESVLHKVLATNEVVRIVETDADHAPLSARASTIATFHGRGELNVSPDQQAQVGENEAILREVNEAVASAATSARLQAPIEFMCECATPSCAETVSLFCEEYELVRSAPERFLVTPGHVQPEVERVVEQHRVYWVVEKFGEAAAEVAEQTDPRSGNGVPPRR